ALGSRTDEHQVVLLALRGELGVLREEPVSGMDRLGAGHQGGSQQVANVEVTARRGGRTDADGLVGEQHCQRRLVCLRVRHHRLHAELTGCPNDSEGDLAAVRDKDLTEQRSPAQSGSMRKSTCPYSTGSSFSTSTSRTTPATSASISFISFIASMMHMTLPALTRSPTST